MAKGRKHRATRRREAAAGDGTGVARRRTSAGTRRYRTGLLALGALVILTAAAAWGTSHLLSRVALGGASSAVPLPDMPARSEMPNALVSVLADADQALRRAVAADAEALAVGRAAGRLGQLYQANTYGARAARCYELAMARDAENPRWPYLLAILRQERGESDSVTALLERAVALAPEYSPARLKLADNQFKRGLAVAARASYEGRLALSPDDPYAHLGLARLALARSEWEVAERHLERATVGDSFATAYRLLASVHEHFGRDRRMQEVLARADGARRFAPAPDPWVDELIEQSYDVEWLLLNVSRYLSAGARALAQRTFERARQLDPRNPEVYVALGRQATDATQARRAFETAVSLAPDHAPALVSLGEMLVRENRPREAEALLRRAIDLEADLAAAHKNLGIAVAADGRFAEGVEHVRRAIALSPNTVSFRYSLASVLRQAGRRDEAAQQFRRILERWPSHPGATQALAALEAGR